MDTERATTHPAATTTRYGRTGIEVPAVCIGTSGWGPVRAGEDEAARDARIRELADAVLAGPLRFLDTSNIYGGGESEALVGRPLADGRSLADRLIIQTKVDRDARTGDFSGNRMRRSIEESLARLGVDRVPVLMLHDPENTTFEAATAPGGPVEALLAIRDEGLAASVGISGGDVRLIQRFVELDVFDALITHNRATLLDGSADALLEAAGARDMGVTNAAPYGGGILTGDPAQASTYGYGPARPAVAEAARRMGEACRRHDVPLAAAALQSSMRDARVHSTVVGISSAARLAATLDLAAVPIPEELWAELAELRPAPGEWIDARR
jgi:D-threo-aldose 1-dehydrogenase